MHTVSNDFERVKFYSINDLSVCHYINRVESVLNSFIEVTEITNINEIIELYNIWLFFQYKIYSRDWNEEQLANYCKIVNQFPEIIGKFFSKISLNSLNSIFQTIRYDYIEDFWKLISKYKIYEKISNDTFKKITPNERFCLTDVLKYKPLVEKFSGEIVNYMKQNIFCAEILLGYYLEQNKNQKELSFPSTLSNEEKTDILNAYISSDDANCNYLQLICNSNGTSELPLSDKLKLKAMRKYDAVSKEVFQNNGGFGYGVEVRFSDVQEDEYKFDTKKDSRILSFTYSTKWIKENQDYPTLLNNFIYLFGYTDTQFRSFHTRKESQLGTFEKLLGVHGKKEYHVGIMFRQIQALAQTQMVGYCKVLEKYNIQLEEVISWFFQEYLKDEFNAEGFTYNAPSNSASYLEKCRNIIAEMDSVLKQFKLWCEDGEIDSELLHISTAHIFIKDIPSMVKDKYIYPCGEDYKTMTHLLFSDQALIHYVPENSGECHTFYELLKKHEVSYDVFQEYQRPGIDWLISNNIIKIDKEKKLVPYIEKIELLYDLFYHEVLCWSYIKKHKKIIDELKERRVVRFESSLFSKPEQDYYNYLFNKSEFDNGLDLRNRYSHGTQIVDEKTNMNDYYIFLRIMILIIIKINEEFCLSQTKDALCGS
uniref:Uncharacterized protein n=1 Tax=uncultured Bacillota bacterium TaxID=344338 RepID=A0A650EMT8_9FIRM|nr:hypothetical protein Firmicute1046_1360 [uncultured Firmicutes bacterium]